MKIKTYSNANILILSAFLISGIFIVSCNKHQSTEHEKLHITKSIATNHKEVKRVGMVTKIKPEHLKEYLVLHADSTSGVRDLLIKYNMRNFSIFMTQLEDGNYYEFGYYEYWGDDFDGDMKLLDKEPRNQAWLNVCDPMQIPLEGGTSWREMQMIYFNY
jgi:L-rhamnose mutarotase